MSELVANASCILGHASGSTVSLGAFVIISTPDVKVKASGTGVFAGTLDFTFTGGNAVGFVPGSVFGNGSIPATAIKTKVAGQFIMREGDFVTMTATGQTLPNPPGTPGPVAGALVEIVSAGQVKVKAE